MTKHAGRRRLNSEEAGVSLKVSASISELVGAHAAEEFCIRAEAIRILVKKGLAR